MLNAIIDIMVVSRSYTTKQESATLIIRNHFMMTDIVKGHKILPIVLKSPKLWQKQAPLPIYYGKISDPRIPCQVFQFAVEQGFRIFLESGLDSSTGCLNGPNVLRTIFANSYL